MEWLTENWALVVSIWALVIVPALGVLKRVIPGTKDDTIIVKILHYSDLAFSLGLARFVPNPDGRVKTPPSWEERALVRQSAVGTLKRLLGIGPVIAVLVLASVGCAARVIAWPPSVVSAWGESEVLGDCVDPQDPATCSLKVTGGEISPGALDLLRKVIDRVPVPSSVVTAPEPEPEE